MQRCLGFAYFYRQFIQGYSKVPTPLTRLTSISFPFMWSEEVASAFQFLKAGFTLAPVLCHPNVTRQLMVEVDASDSGVGAVLSQCLPEDQRFASQSLLRVEPPV